MKALRGSETEPGAWIWRLLISWREATMELNICLYVNVKTCLTRQWM